MSAAYGLGLIGLMALIVFVDSGRGAGFVIAWILIVLFYARNTLRCPLCGASVLNAPIGQSIRWLKGPERKCYRCRADYHDAVAAKSTTRPDPA